MAWVELAFFNANEKNWQYSETTNFNLFQLVHQVPNATATKTYNFRGLISLVQKSNNKFALSQIKFIYSQNIVENFFFAKLSYEPEETRLAVKNITKYNSNAQWTIRAYYWDQIVTNINHLSEQSINNIEQIINTNNIVNLSPQSLAEIENLIDTNNNQQETNLITFFTNI